MLFVGIGFPGAVRAGEGFTIKTWFELYIEQLDLTSYYTLYERKCNHLYQCSRQMGAFLRLAEIAVESLKTRSHPGERDLGRSIPRTSSRRRSSAAEPQTATWRNAAEQLDEAPIRPVKTCDGDLLPLLSDGKTTRGTTGAPPTGYKLTEPSPRGEAAPPPAATVVMGVKWQQMERR